MNRYELDADWEDYDPYESDADWEDITPGGAVDVDVEDAGFQAGTGERPGGWLQAAKGLLVAPAVLKEQIGAKALQLYRGSDIDTEEDWKDKQIREAAENLQGYIKEYGGPEDDPTSFLGIKPRHVAESVGNLAYSGISAGAGLAVGGATRLIPRAGKYLSYPAGGAASGVAAYRMAKDEIMQSYYDSVQEEAMERAGRPLNEEEWQQAKEMFESQATQYGLWEAVPEALGSMVGFKLLTGPLKSLVGSKIASKMAGKLSGSFLGKAAGVAGRGAGVLASEEIQEATTTAGLPMAESGGAWKGQAGIEAKAGLREKDIGWVEGLKEVWGPTAVTTGILGPFAKVAHSGFSAVRKGLASDEKNILDSGEGLLTREESQRAKYLDQLTTGIDSGEIDIDHVQALREKLDDADPLAQMLDDVFLQPSQFGPDPTHADPQTADFEARLRNQATINKTMREQAEAEEAQAVVADQIEAQAEWEDISPGQAGLQVEPSQAPDLGTPVDMSAFEQVPPKGLMTPEQLEEARRGVRYERGMQVEPSQVPDRATAIDMSGFIQTTNLKAAGREPEVNEPAINSILTNTNFFGDSSDAKALRSKGFESFKRDRQLVILSKMRSSLDNPQVLGAVIESIPVDVMDSLIGSQWTTDDLLHDPAMLTHRFSITGDVSVSKPVIRFVDSLSSIIKGISTGDTTKKTGLPPSNIVLGSKRDATIGAGPRRSTFTPPSIGPVISAGPGTEKSGLPSTGIPSSIEGGSAIRTNILPDGRHIASTEIDGQEIEVDINPSEKQKQAGNYLKGAIKIQGFDISIENPKGSTRTGTAPDGTEWQTEMTHHYGYFKRSEGKDGDQIDVFVGPSPESETAYIVDQIAPETGKFDEHKVLMGFESLEDAEEGYLSNYEEGWQGIGNITEVPIDELKKFVEGGKQTKPYAPFEMEERRQDIEKRKRIDEMTPEEMQKELKTDFLTGLGNKRALHEAKPKPVMSSLDMDSLGYVNDTYGHDAGDTALKLMGDALKNTDAVRDTYHISGDEFVIQGETEQEVDAAIQRAYEYLKKNPLEIEHEDGSVDVIPISFSYGKGETYETADKRLLVHKKAREARGERSPTKVEPPGVFKKPARGVETEDRGEGVPEAEEIAPPAEKPPKIRKAPVRGADVRTLRGRIKMMGGINFLNFTGELRNLPTSVRFLANKKGFPIDLAEETLKAEGWLAENEDLLDLLRDPEVLKRDNLKRDMEEKAPHELAPQEKRIKEEMEHEPEAPPEGEYVQMKAEDLPVHKTMTIIEGDTVDGWDVYRVTEKDEFGVTLKDGTTIELGPEDVVEVLKTDIEEAPEKPAEPKREDPKTAATGVISGGKVGQIERGGYEIGWADDIGELKKGTERYYDLVGMISGGKADQFVEAGLSIRPVEKIEEAPKAEEKPIKPKEEPLGKPGASDKIARWVENRLHDKNPITWQQLFESATTAFGGTQAEGAFTPKDAYDAMELGVNRFLDDQLAIDPTMDRKFARGNVMALKGLIELLPTQTKRTKEMDEFQQFSTPPPLAYVANWAANISENDVILEPSAGIGGIAIFSKLAGAKKVIVNELSPRRAELLKLLGFDRVFTEDAEQINNILPKDVKPSVIVMNPPFSATGGRLSKTATRHGARHIEQALERLEPGGRLVAVVGKGMADDAASFRIWWNKIKKKYDVKANIGIDGEEYRKYGTTFDNQLIIIDKTDKKDYNIITGKVKKIEDLIPLIEEVRNERTHPAERKLIEREGERVAPEGEPGPGPVAPVLVPTDALEPRQREDRGEIPATGREPGRRPGTVAPGRGDEAVRGERHRRPSEPVRPGLERPGKPSERSIGKPALKPDREAPGIPDTEPSIELKIKATKREAHGELTEDLYEGYSPERVKVTGSKKHPTKLVQSAAMAAVRPPKPTYTPTIPQKSIESGEISDIQIESVVYAGQAHEGTLPDGSRRGYFIGDGTGVGKGREIAAIMWDNFNKGRKKAIWISEKSGLIKDAKRDVVGVGWNPDLIFDQNKVKDQDGILFTSYDTLKARPREEGAQSRLEQIVEWVGEDFDGVIAFDESHNMGNAVSVKGERGTKPPSLKALAGVELQERLPNARIVYVSATGATEVINLAYASRLGLWGEGTPFASVADFVNQISAGGVAGMELVAQNMKSMGVYNARSLSYDGVDNVPLEHKLTDEQEDIYNKLAEGWQVVLRDIHAALLETGVVGETQTGKEKTLNGHAKKNAMGAFWGAHQRFFNQIITSMQTPAMINAIKKDMEAGHAAVIQLVNTMEAPQDRAISRLTDEDSLEDLDLTPREILMEYVKKSFPTVQYEQYTDDKGNARSRPVTDSKGAPVINAEAVRMRERLLDELGSIRVPDSPLDMIIDEFGTEAVAEVTGRKRRIVWKRTEKGMERVIEKRSRPKCNADAELFQDNRKRILIFSEAGGTGRSYHADLDIKNQRKRIHYLLQAGWRADKAVQGLGRTHRSNQKQPPKYVLVTTNIKGQKRFISSVARRLDQLGALTKGQRQTGSQGIFNARDNLESDYAHDALVQFYDDLADGNIETIGIADFQDQTGLKLVDEYGRLNRVLPPMKSFLNRLLSLNLKTMNSVFDEFSLRMDQVIEAHINAGTLDVGLETLKADKIEKASEETVYTDEKSDAKAKYIKIDVTNPTPLYEWEHVKNYAEKFFKNIKSGKVWAGKLRTITNRRTGAIEDVWVLKSPTYGEQRIRKNDFSDEKWEKLRAGSAEKAWEQTIDEAPKTMTEQKHLITGSLLPIWDRLIGHPRIMRMQTDQGERFIGRLVSPRDLNKTLRNLGASAVKVEMAPKEIHDRILNQNYKIELANQWKISRRRVSGEERIEITGPSFRDFEHLQKYGVFSERINYDTRYFIPASEDGVKAIESIIKNAPVVAAVPPTSAPADSDAALFSVKEKAKKEDIALSREEVETLRKAKPDTLKTIEGRGHRNKITRMFKSKGFKNPDAFRVVKPETNEQKQIVGIAKNLGLKAVFFDTLDPQIGVNGVIDANAPNVVYLNTKPKNKSVLMVAGHEVLHTLKAKHPEVYEFLKSALIKNKAIGFDEYLKRINEQRARVLPDYKPMKAEEVFDEFMADFAGEQWADPEFWKILADENPTLAQKVMEIVREVLDKIMSYLTDNNLKGKYFEDIKAAQKNLAVAIKEYAEREGVEATIPDKALTEEMPLFQIEGPKGKAELDKWANKFLDKYTKDIPVKARDYKPTPSMFEKFKDDWFSEKDWSVQKNSVEAKKLQDAIKETLGEKRYTRKCKDTDKAIHVYLDLKRNPDHLDEYYGDLNPEQQKIVDLAQTIESNLKLKAIADYIANEYEQTGLHALDAGIIHNVLDNYAARAWKIPKKFSTDNLQKFKTTSRHAKQRVFETILEGQAIGFELQVEGATNNLSLLKDEISRTIEDKRLVKEMMAAKDEDGNPLIVERQVEGYQAIDHPNFTYWGPAVYVKEGEIRTYGPGHLVESKYGAIKGGNERASHLFDSKEEANRFIKEQDYPGEWRVGARHSVREKKQLYAPIEMAKSLNRILGVSRLKGAVEIGGVSMIDVLTKYNAVFKAWILITSFFHHLAFMRSFLMGTRHKTLAEWSPRQAYKKGLEAINEMKPEIELLVRNGLTLGRMQDWEESILRNEQTIFGKAIDKIGPRSKRFKDWINNLRERQADFLFRSFGAGLKAQAGLIEYRNALKEHPEMEPNDRAKMVAKLINDDFGGLHLGRMDRDPTIQHIFRLLALAPDWTESNVRTMYKAFVSGEKETRQLYRRFWASVVTKGVIATLLANILLSFGDDEDLLDKFKRAWKEGNFRWLDVDITRLYKLLGGKTEARKYFSIVGHFKDPIKFVRYSGRSMKHKGSVVSRMFFEAYGGTDWRGQRFTTLSELIGIDDKGVYVTTVKGKHKAGDPKGGKLAGRLTAYGKTGTINWEQVPSYLFSQVRGVQPIQVQNLISYITGEVEGFDAVARSVGLHTSSTYPTERSMLKDFSEQYVDIRSKGRNLAPLKKAVKEYNERQDDLDDGVKIPWLKIVRKGNRLRKAESANIK